METLSKQKEVKSDVLSPPSTTVHENVSAACVSKQGFANMWTCIMCNMCSVFQAGEFISYPVTVSSRQHFLDEDRGAVGPVGASSYGDAQTAGSRHWNELNHSFPWMTENTQTQKHISLWRKEKGLYFCEWRRSQVHRTHWVQVFLPVVHINLYQASMALLSYFCTVTDRVKVINHPILLLLLSLIYLYWCIC